MNAFEQLAAYREAGSEKAFSELVRRYTNLVYSVAKRRLTDGALAEDVAQTVFSRLAKTPPNLRSDAELVAWLHRTTTHVAIDFWRSETRRRTREQQAALMQSTFASDTRAWDEMSPHLDQALDELNDADRQAVLLRFFERRPMRDIGQILGVSEDAAKMRVSRAIDRLRNQLSARGVACTVILLATMLTQRAVEAAPAHLLTSLGAIKLAVPTATGAGGLTGLILQLAKSKVAVGSAAALVVALVVAIFIRISGEGESPFAAPQPDIAQAQSARISSRRALASVVEPPASTAAEPHEKVRFVLRVIDKDTRAGLAGARVRAAYFYAGGVGERHEFQTDADGNASVPYPNSPEKNAGLNVFVGITGYVPKAIGFDRLTEPAKDYLLELEPALAVGGTVVDESGWPVAGVTLEALRSGDYKNGSPNTDFQTTKVTTDAGGRWFFHYVPKEYATVDFYLSCSNYAVTRISVPVGEPGSLNATLVIERGFTVAGRVTDTEGRPIVGATVQERHEFGFRKLSTQTDKDGYYAMHGLGIPALRVVDFSNPLKPKSTWKEPEQKADLVVQVEGMASQLQNVQLLEPTNTVNFVLAAGNVFRGRVVDEAGNPISGAVVRIDSHFDPYIPNRFDWLTHTDADGRFEWDSAPAEETCFWFEADGYDIIRGRPMLADGTDHEIKLARKGAERRN